MINVTKTFLPPQEEYQAILKRAWDTGWMTNRGVLVKELEDQLKSYLGVNQMIAMTNGTLPLQIAIKALNLEGEIITTPFSYVATTSSIVWEGCTPVFVDIHPEYLTIDETKIEAAITPKATAILATHVFGNPCHIEAIEAIAKKYNLKVIYDAAHCFGVTYKEQSIFNYGDVSTCSFHSTKLFHTGEGGAIFCNDAHLLNSLFYHHNFGHKGKEDFQGIGINGKMSELQAALGLSVLPYMEQIIASRKNAIEVYNSLLETINVKTITIRPETEWNFSYYPILFEEEAQLLKVVAALNKKEIYPRRYFYPSLNTLPYIIHSSLPLSEAISKRILCLPLYYRVDENIQILIANIIKSSL
ncbi:dTDP-4-amino-4,6-dideoxygalactose transaminase [Mesoflavibacter sabulilitoris]|uniref:Aminotransferase DegT n=1 Tax=Mesoflavibacter zeaxanthinifaciens subsp. sabulilitoris TaxID=1520893 RepID=A0A2T1NAZ5_9FLAO|nr:DegT/DnrJ/EryC1/StrS family aminotransferase [Mesoflavibacter zeaxanthinifaciens]MBB3123548.1 dTDP-4-amino-4,6-dideoxygalactose transaminase [Mesoflavibacter zeaxanthinifaciens subsp. sabulilitoris]PSG89321.1 aminotransferase DegT [Mesoflavibacter zeaxanthinifaciens subsp. sabulilitoris]